MLQPSRVKYRKPQRGVIRGIAVRGSTVAFGAFALKTVEPGYLNSRQIESARRTMIRLLRKGGKLWIRIFPDKPYTKKPLEVPMVEVRGLSKCSELLLNLVVYSLKFQEFHQKLLEKLFDSQVINCQLRRRSLSNYYV